MDWGFDFFFRYYATDWMLFLFMSFHLWMLGNKLRSAFVVGMIGCIFGVAFGVVTESAATIMMNATFFFGHMRAFCKWSE